jgi:hypothetical protein
MMRLATCRWLSFFDKTTLSGTAFDRTLPDGMLLTFEAPIQRSFVIGKLAK